MMPEQETLREELNYLHGRIGALEDELKDAIKETSDFRDRIEKMERLLKQVQEAWRDGFLDGKLDL